jgi:diketogulonate reductase-like aldo/keto reductase
MPIRQESFIMTGKRTLITLNSGVAMPILGLGVYQSNREETAQAVATAISSGYRLIDTAAAYMNEREVGEEIRHSGVDRSDIFVTTKLWMSDYGYEKTLHAFDRSLQKLGLDRLDLYLLHWPVPTDFESTIASYKAAVRLLADGRVRAIGVCNFTAKHLEDLIARTEVVPAVNQVELHPFFTQEALRETHARLGIVTQAWSPIGGVTRYWVQDPNAVQDPLVHPTITGLAAKYGKTPAQIVLRWQIEHGISVIPKSGRPERIAENIAIFDFALTKDEVAAVDALDVNGRGGPDLEVVNPQLFNVTVEN